MHQNPFKLLNQRLNVETFEDKEVLPEIECSAEVAASFPHTYSRNVLGFRLGELDCRESMQRVGCVFSGGPAPGGHNVIAGLHWGLSGHNIELVGFKNGPRGIFENDRGVLTDSDIKEVIDKGGFHLIGTGRDKIRKENFERCLAACADLDALVVIGGDDSNTNAAILAEYFAGKEARCKVIGVPKTIDGDLKNKYISVPFGFATAAEIYAFEISSLSRATMIGANPDFHKGYFFCKIMGRKASNLALEVALRVDPTMCLIGEIYKQKNATLTDVVNDIFEVIKKRREEHNLESGIILVPEGLFEFINDISEALYSGNVEQSAFYKSIPGALRKSISGELDSHGNANLTAVPTEKLLAQMVSGVYENHFGEPLSFSCHSYGYEARCADPNAFDREYAYGLGTVAAALALNGKNGYLACLRRDTQQHSYRPQAIPLTAILTIEERNNKQEFVIEKYVVHDKCPCYLEWSEQSADVHRNVNALFPPDTGNSYCCVCERKQLFTYHENLTNRCIECSKGGETFNKYITRSGSALSFYPERKDICLGYSLNESPQLSITDDFEYRDSQQRFPSENWVKHSGDAFNVLIEPNCGSGLYELADYLRHCGASCQFVKLTAEGIKPLQHAAPAHALNEDNSSLLTPCVLPTITLKKSFPLPYEINLHYERDEQLVRHYRTYIGNLVRDCASIRKYIWLVSVLCRADLFETIASSFKSKRIATDGMKISDIVEQIPASGYEVILLHTSTQLNLSHQVVDAMASPVGILSFAPDREIHDSPLGPSSLVAVRKQGLQILSRMQELLPKKKL